MSAAWSIGRTPMPGHRPGGLFDHPDWADALRVLGATPLFAHAGSGARPLLVARFVRGPLRVAYAGFPISDPDGLAVDGGDVVESARALARACGCDIVRVNLPMQVHASPTATAALEESWIAKLAHWRTEASRKLRKDLAYAARASAGLRIEAAMPDPQACFGLHRATVASRRGRLRYGADYFVTLARIGARNPLLRCFSALGPDGRTVAFAVLAIDARVAYYLHGAADESSRRGGVTDLLMRAMIQSAVDAGCDRFTSMASPWRQGGLSQFKRKWADQAGLSVTEDIAATALGHVVRAGLRVRHRADRQAAARLIASGPFAPERSRG